MNMHAILSTAAVPGRGGRRARLAWAALALTLGWGLCQPVAQAQAAEAVERTPASGLRPVPSMPEPTPLHSMPPGQLPPAQVQPGQVQPGQVPPLPPMPALPPASHFAPLAEDPNAIRVLLSPELETTLVSQMVGRIVELQAALGAPVTAGQPLVTFDCNEWEARLKMARAENSAARETLGVKQRLRKLQAAGDLEVSMARSEVLKTAAAIEVAQAQLAHCVVVAPFDGRVVKVHVKPHQGVNIGVPLVELVSDGPLKLRLNVPSRLMRQVPVGTPIEVDILETGNTHVAHVSAVNARVDAVAQTIELEATLEGAVAELLPGMSGVARLPVAQAGND